MSDLEETQEQSKEQSKEQFKEQSKEPTNRKEENNPLRNEKITGLMFRFAIPSIVAMLVGSLYNIVDQFFIGQSVGTLGNAATNIAFPFAMVCTAGALLFGIGGASCFNLAMGRGEKETAAYYIGNAVLGILVFGLLLCGATELFLEPLLVAFGSPEEVLPYAMDYVGITAIGFPFLILTVGGGHLIRADGSPKMTMICNLSGAIINTIIDYIFVMRMDMGMKGAAYATIIGQIFSAILVIIYLTRFKTVPLKFLHFRFRGSFLGKIASIGAASCFNQIAMMIVQVILNNSLKSYGAKSVYGESIPIACSGIAIKVFQVFFSVVIGLSQGSQPIESYNYGAQNYKRVKDAYQKALIAGSVIAILSFILFQTIPRQIIAIFGEGSEEYFEFGEKYFRIYFFFIFLNFMQPITSTFFTSIGKPVKGIFLSLTRQIIYFLPLILILPGIYGIDGILYAAPIADFLAAATTITMAVLEYKDMNRLEQSKAARE